MSMKATLYLEKKSDLQKRLDIVIIVIKVTDIYTCTNGFDQDCMEWNTIHNVVVSTGQLY